MKYKHFKMPLVVNVLCFMNFMTKMIYKLETPSKHEMVFVLNMATSSFEKRSSVVAQNLVNFL